MNERQRHDTETLLRQGDWFSGLPAALQDQILGRSVLRTYDKGQVIQIEDAPAIGLYAILEGQVSLVRHVSNDEPVLIHVGGPGFWFGDVGVLINDTPMVTAVAITTSRILLLPKLEFDRIVADEPRYFAHFARKTIGHFRIVIRFLAETLQLSPDSRLRLRLADLADIHRTQINAVKESTVELAISQAELARLIGLSRQKLNSRLQVLRDEGLIELAPRRIRVLDPARLRASVAQTLAGDD